MLSASEYLVFTLFYFRKRRKQNHVLARSILDYGNMQSKYVNKRGDPEWLERQRTSLTTARGFRLEMEMPSGCSSAKSGGPLPQQYLDQSGLYLQSTETLALPAQVGWGQRRPLSHPPTLD